jgi:hypothetical protein
MKIKKCYNGINPNKGCSMKGGVQIMGGKKLCTMTDGAAKRGLSADALVSCRLCGAMANDPSNVCDPVQYPEEGVLGD